MLSAAARSRLAVVLVRARNPQNIGAAARAMHDFGFDDLRIVNEFAPPFEAAQMEATSAVNAGTVMRAARLFPSLREAIADCTLVAGTTAVGGRGLQQAVLPLQDAATLLLAGLADAAPELLDQTMPGSNREAHNREVHNRVALLFGSEKTGLSNEELSFCSVLLTIPMWAPEGRHLSMNLGQAVAVCLYELTRSGFEGSRELPPAVERFASAEDRERVLELLLGTMERSGYARRFPANARVEVVRRLVQQLGTSTEEAATWMGLFRQILRALPRDESEPDQT